MSVFDTAYKKINSLLGITSKGAAAAANSLPVTIATDDVLLGRLPLGQHSMATSLGVVLSSDSDGVVVDNGAAAVGTALTWRNTVIFYQAIPTKLTTGRTGLVGGSIWRGMKYATPYVGSFANQAASQDVTEMQVSASLTTGYANIGSPDTSFGLYDAGANKWVNATPKYWKITLGAENWDVPVVRLDNNTAQVLTLDVYLWLSAHNAAEDVVKICSCSVTNGSYVILLGQPGGTGADSKIQLIPALNMPASSLILALTPPADITAGNVRFSWARK